MDVGVGVNGLLQLPGTWSCQAKGRGYASTSARWASMKECQVTVLFRVRAAQAASLERQKQDVENQKRASVLRDAAKLDEERIRAQRDEIAKLEAEKSARDARYVLMCLDVRNAWVHSWLYPDAPLVSLGTLACACVEPI